MEKSDFFDQKWFLYGLFAFFFFDVLSLISYTMPVVGWITLPILAITFVLLLLRDLRWALYIPLAELAWDSFGSGLFWNISGFHLTIRMVIFVISIIVGMLAILFKRTAASERLRWRNIPFSYVPFLILGVWGFAQGFVYGHPIEDIWYDGNAYLFLLYLPLWLYVFKKENIPQIASLLAAAALGLSIKSLLLFNIFANEYTFLNVPYLYLWLRDTRIGEMTQIAGSVWRIFIQSQLYIGIAFLQALTLVIAGFKTSIKKLAFLVVLLSAILVSFSRSFWTGLVFGICVLVISSLWLFHQRLKTIARYFMRFIGIVLVSMVVTVLLVVLPFGRTGFTDSLMGRFSSEAGGTSRLQLLNPLLTKIFEQPFLGQGFGTTVTYFSNDPRIRTFSNPDGKVTTYAFEWGYLDQALKFGILGLVILLAVLAQQLYYGFRIVARAQDRNLPVLAACIGLIFVASVHTLSPYLNHPLGLGYLMLTMVIINHFRLSHE